MQITVGVFHQRCVIIWQHMDWLSEWQKVYCFSMYFSWVVRPTMPICFPIVFFWPFFHYLPRVFCTFLLDCEYSRFLCYLLVNVSSWAKFSKLSAFLVLFLLLSCVFPRILFCSQFLVDGGLPHSSGINWMNFKECENRKSLKPPSWQYFWNWDKERARRMYFNP